ncbi:type V toxin-antitoxin system endoribonuclease antitoxin GhoS [Cronobacter turicensis]|uniref:type V toxin-antitoxin system endoribonuclease antitoxin GhoS n=1 Tax=Cronobacter turicensis TaxID=413502 RepID=UPI001375FCA6|nr:type V toxin-antitoxin system endoribonuclease antitoxin GhoS [Cronobacter turicensis]MEB8539868.1 type V toxin-antitoxin system endoribonuclease antitoxin GhoS [Cronobacter sakazakii]EKM0526440.1 type V toxin-antitoxin system endoribonuclease antitoxin GhoS [Cronobacter turicensis]ELQ5998154.1 type V toxin-antitoxin system endoribonuclease antitoxin GhoS [Cronobacter turicensis]ELQ6127450.1 type V toxin-antitoxin system endoribonuclease antitoxin GhoS [Cronobacter turicensis]ELY3550765.1 t
MSEVTRYVVTVTFHEKNLTDINELNNHLTRGGFQLTLADDDGKIHELGTNTFGLVSALSEQEVAELAEGLGEAALDQKPQVNVTTFETWLRDNDAV